MGRTEGCWVLERYLERRGGAGGGGWNGDRGRGGGENGNENGSCENSSSGGEKPAIHAENQVCLLYHQIVFPP